MTNQFAADAVCSGQLKVDCVGRRTYRTEALTVQNDKLLNAVYVTAFHRTLLLPSTNVAWQEDVPKLTGRGI